MSYSEMPLAPIASQEMPERSGSILKRFSLRRPPSSIRFGISASVEDVKTPNLDRTQNSKMPQIPNPLQAAEDINWDQHSNRFLTNQISDLSRSEQELVRTLASSAIVREIARELSEPRNVVALALLAKLVEENDRAAQRFAKRFLGSLDQTKMEDALSIYQVA